MKRQKNAPAITWAEIKKQVNELNEEQLSMPVLWWGDERGGNITSCEPLSEDFGLSDEGYEPVSSFEEEQDKPTDILPKGMPILYTDEIIE